MKWTREEMVLSLADSIKRKSEFENKIVQEIQYQESLFDMLNEEARKIHIPQAFDK